MPSMNRIKTKYPGVYYIESVAIGSNKPERIYYIMYRKGNKLIEEKAGRQFQDDMTPARASKIRAERIEGNQLSNIERRAAEHAAKLAEAGRWTVDRLWELYQAQKPNSKAIQSDKYRYDKYVKDMFGEKEPYQIVQLDVDRIRIKLLKTLKPQTVKHILALLKRIVNFGVKKQVCSGLGFKVEVPRVDNCKTEDLSPAQLSKLLEAIEKSQDIQAAHIMKMALYTGMRRGELLKLKWNDIDFDRGFIQIIDPKSGINQKIPLNDPARDVLLSHPRSDSAYIFTRNDGKPFTSISRRVNPIKSTAKLPTDFRPLHGLRHVYASMLASSGQVDMYTLQKLLTHKSPQMTQRYAHLRDETMKRASNLAGTIIQESVNNNIIPNPSKIEGNHK